MRFRFVFSERSAVRRWRRRERGGSRREELRVLDLDVMPLFLAMMRGVPGDAGDHLPTQFPQPVMGAAREPTQCEIRYPRPLAQVAARSSSG